MGKSNGLTKHQLEIIASASAEAAVAAYEKKAKKEKQDGKKRDLRNTTLLLENYRKLKELCAETLEDISVKQIIHDEFEEDLDFSEETLTLESLSKYRERTLMIMNHVDKMLQAYEITCANGPEEEKRRYKILQLRYLSEVHLSVKEIVKLHSIDQSTVYRDTRKAIKDMSTYLYGIDALDFR